MTRNSGGNGSASGATRSPMPLTQEARALEAHRDIGAELDGQRMPIDVRCLLGVRRPDRPQQGSRVGRAASEAGRNRQLLVKVDGAQPQSGRFRAQQRERSVEDIGADDRACERPADCDLRRRGEIERDAIGNRREGDQASSS